MLLFYQLHIKKQVRFLPLVTIKYGTIEVYKGEKMSNKVSQYGICPFATTQKVLTGKWGLVIIYQLSTGTKRFNELQRLIPGITQTILTRHLRQLETDKIIKRQVFAEVPPRVEYSLTDIGKRFRSVLDAIELWGLDYINELNLTPSQNEAKN